MMTERNTNTEGREMTMTQIDFYAEVTGTNAWAKGGKLRLYAKTAKHISAFLDFEDGDVSNGAKAVVFVKDCGQPWAWVRSQKESATAETLRPLFVKYLAARAYAEAKEVGYDFTDHDVEVVTAILDEYDSLAKIGESDERMHEVEAKAKAAA